MKKTLKVIGLVAAGVAVLTAGHAAGRILRRQKAQVRRLARLQRVVGAARNALC